MTRDEAKILLQACSLESAASTSPEVEEALAMVAQDPELAAWWAAEQEFDDAFSLEMDRFAAPLDLRAKIVRSHDPKPQSSSIFSHWFSPGSLRTFASFATAFALVVFVSVMLFEPREATALDELPGFLTTIQQEIEKNSAPKKPDGSDEDFLKYLEEQNAPLPSRYLESIQGFDRTGASFLEEADSKIGVLFLENDSGQIFRLFVINRDVSDSTSPPFPETSLRQYPSISVLTWKDGGKVHVLATTESIEVLQKLR
tara:strand:- start:4832 stop:5602 length:771 start_codon:yes stop_codon:yes gene_type:complete